MSRTAAPKRIWNLEIRAPQLAVLRLPVVLTWFVLGGSLAWLLAPSFVGETQSIGSPYDYMILWLLPSLLFALYWTERQWHDRAALPRERSLDLWWSTAMSTLVIATIFSVVIIAGLTAEQCIRTLRSRTQVLRDIDGLNIKPDYVFLEKHEERFSLNETSIAVGLLPERLRAGEKSIDPHVVDPYTVTKRAEDIKKCYEDFYANERPVDERMDASEYDPGRKSPLGYAIDATAVCKYDPLKEEITINIKRLAIAHHLYTSFTVGESPDVALSLVYLSTVLGCIAGFASVFQVGRAFTTVGALTVLSFLIPESFVDLSRRTKYISVDVGAWGKFVWVLYGILLVVLVLVILRRKARSPSCDLGMLLVQLWPLFMLFAHWRINNGAFASCHAIVCKGGHPRWSEIHLYPYGVVAWVLFSGFFLSPYRKLPHSI